MRLDRVLRILFILYCLEAGTLLVLVPWSQVWDRLLLGLPWLAVREFAAGGLARGLASGFGMCHLVWGLHDLTGLLKRWRAR